MVAPSAAAEDVVAASGTEPAPRAAGPPAAIAFVGAIAVVLLYALRGGGSYDLLVFQENALVVWWVLGLGLGLGLFPRTRPSRLQWALMAALAAYAAWTALSLLWTDSSELTGTEVARVVGYLGLVALAASALDRATWRPAAAGLGAGAFVVCVVAVGSRLAPSVFGTDHADIALHFNRLSVPFGYWNSVGAWGAMSAALGLAWSAHDPSRGRRALALGFVPVAILTTYLTYSRAGIGGLAIGVLAVLLLSRNRLTAALHALVAAAGAAAVILVVRGSPQIAHSTGTGGALTVLAVLLAAAAACVAAAVLTGAGGMDRVRIPRRVTRTLALTGGLVVVIGAVARGPHLVSTNWHTFTRVTVQSPNVDPAARLTNLSGTRYPLWKATVHAFTAHPIKGLGAGTIQFWWNEHATNGQFIRDAHSLWLENLAELGLPGLLLIVAVSLAALGIAVAARRRLRRTVSAGAGAALIAAFVVWLVQASVDWMWESTAVTVLALTGIAVLGVRLSRARPRPARSLRLGFVLVALAGGVIQLPGLLSTAAVRRSQTAARAGQPDVALGWARAALSAEPWSASAYEQEGLVLESAGRLRAAAASLQAAITREPQNYEHWLVLARIETERGRLGVAVRDYEQARRLRPRASVFAQVTAPARRP